MSEKLVTVAYFSNYIEADLARQLLEDEGIKAFVMGQNVATVYSGVPAAVDVELQTPESQAEQAKEILEANRPQKQGSEQDLEDEQEFEDEQEYDDEQEYGDEQE